jgi:Uma2 family endonuclease
MGGKGKSALRSALDQTIQYKVRAIMPIPKEKERYTYKDYCKWPDEERWELIDGVAYDMTPAPNFRHQDIAGNLFNILKNALKEKECVVGIAPTDIVLSEHDVVQPDVFVICDKDKITDKNIQGAPEFVAEILSPSTSQKDRWIKKELYEKYGVLEYLIIDPDGEYIERYLLGDNGEFDPGQAFDAEGVIQLKSLSGLEISVQDVLKDSTAI